MTDLLSKDQERDLLIAAQSGDIKAKQTLITMNYGLCRSMAYQMSRPPGVDIDDLIHEGVVGLSRAIDKFDLTKECRLSTYAWWWIRLAAQRSIPDVLPTISLDCVLDSEASDKTSFFDCLKDPHNYADEAENNVLAEEMMSCLPDRLRKVIELRYGFKGNRPHTLREASKVLGVSFEQVRRLEDKAMKMMREQLREDGRVI